MYDSLLASRLQQYLRKESDLRIEHVAIWTTDLERLKTFYATYFGAISSKK